jgi:hypothetical protein
MDLLTQSISLLFRPRLKAISRYALHAEEIQLKQLKQLIESAKQTEWGMSYDYKSINSYQTFATRVPLQDYDNCKPYIERMVAGEKDILWTGSTQWFAKSSGTTNDKSKFIPVTKDILKHTHYLGGLDCTTLYLENNPNSRFFRGKGLILGGSHEPAALNSKSNCGDLSAVLLQNLPPLVNLIREPSKKIILMGEWERKIKAIVSATKNKNINNLSGVPSWMLVLIKAVLKETGKESLTEVWPNLEVFFHGGVSFDPYREQYKSLIPSDQMHYMETYNASEGFFAIQNDLQDKGMLLMLDYGVFYEFIPMQELEKEHPLVVPLVEVELNQVYAMVISTLGGLWRYQIGDTVQFTSIRPYKIKIAGRTKHFINAFGEELMVDNADKALAATCLSTGAKVKEYTAAPLFMLNKAKGRHQWVIEFEQSPSSLDSFALQLDQHLQELNSDYEAKRYKEISLQPLEISTVPEGTFYQWLKEKGKLGGQHKIPRLNNSRTYVEELLNIGNIMPPPTTRSAS